jgi:hypothetical protein
MRHLLDMPQLLFTAHRSFEDEVAVIQYSHRYWKMRLTRMVVETYLYIAMPQLQHQCFGQPEHPAFGTKRRSAVAEYHANDFTWSTHDCISHLPEHIYGNARQRAVVFGLHVCIHHPNGTISSHHHTGRCKK